MRSRALGRLFCRYRDRADGAALAAVFDATAQRLLELACHLVRDPAQAEDLVQTTFLAAIQRAKSYDEAQPLEAWLYGILWREAQMARRNAARRLDPRELNSPAEREPSDVLVAEELPAAVRQVLERLPRHEREVLSPFLFEDVPAEELAQRLGRSAGTVRSQIHRALERVRRQLPAGLSPVAGVIPIRGLASVRSDVLAAAGVPVSTAAVLVGGGLGSRALLGAAGLVVALGGWIAVHVASTPDEPGSNPALVKLESETDSPSPLAAVASASQRTPVTSAKDGTATLALSLVNWPKEHPVAGLRVEVWPGEAPKNGYAWPAHESSEKPIAAGTTNEEGRLDLQLPAGEPLRLELPWQGAANELSGPLAPYWGKMFDLGRLAPSEQKPLRLQILYGWEFPRRARIVADEDGRPLLDARVLCTGRAPSGLVDSVLATGAENSSRWRSVDSTGSFELVLTYEQQFDTFFAMLAPGRSPLLTRLTGDKRGDELSEFRLVRSASIAGTLVDDARASKPPYHLRMTVASHDLMTSTRDKVGGWEARLGWECDTRADGSFEIDDVAANARIDVKAFRGESQVFWINGELPDAPQLAPGESRKVEWHIHTGTAVTGIALDKNLAPVANHEIWLLRMVIATVIDPGPVGVLISDDREMVVARTRSNEQGRFTFANIEPGTWWVGITPPDNDHSPAPSDPVIPLAVQFEVPKGVPSVAVDIRPKTTLPIRGKVLQPDGTPLADAGIYFFRADDSGPERGRSGPDGTFAIVPADSGEWKLKARAPHLGFADSSVIEAQAGQDGAILKLKIAATITGEVACADCGEDRQLQISLLGEEIMWQEPGAFGGSRTFSFGGLRAGTYEILAQCEPDRAGIVRGVVGEPGVETSNVRVQLEAAAVLVVSYSGKRKRCNFQLLVGDTTTGSRDVMKGATRRIIVPPGIVKLRPDDGGSERVLKVGAGTETEVVLDDT